MWFYVFLDYFFFVFHTLFVLFVLTGWILRKTREAHFWAVLCTGLSWFGLGYWYGWGFCFCTEWHWQARIKQGLEDMPHSYIKFLLDNITGLDWDASWVDAATLAGFLAAMGIAIYFKRKKWGKKKSG